MRSFLLFELYGPFASWGEEAVGEVRPSELRPTRSALLGLLAAALGLDRADAAGQQQLADAVRFAVAVEAPGVPLVDYHTVQTRAPRRGKSFGSRAEQLAAPSHELNTILSQRHYRADALYRVAVWSSGETAAVTLEALAAALLRPRFPLYLGRKSCPPALPLVPRLAAAETVCEALAASPRPVVEGLAGPKDTGKSMWLYWEGGRDLAGVEPKTSAERRDEPRSRRPWAFARRLEHAAPLPREEATKCT